MRSPKGSALLIACGFLLIQVAWILAVPPFRAMDEFDHAYRAAAVAHGQWVALSEDVADGRGKFVQVPQSLVEAAAPVCSWYEYTGPDNCRAHGKPDESGMVEVASGAADYNPIFYWVVGTPSQLFSGFDFLYALRLTGAMLNAGVLGLCAYLLMSGARPRWKGATLFVVATPTLIYSTASAAPNGLEMTGGLLVWSAASAMATSNRANRDGFAILMLGLGGFLLVVPRLLGPMWLVLILISAVSMAPLGTYLKAFRSHPRATALCGTLIATGMVLGGGWSLVARPNQPQDEAIQPGDFNPFWIALREVPLWILQSIAGFPLRNEPAHPVVYGLAFSVLVLFIVLVGRSLVARDWRILIALVTVWLGVQFVITVATVATAGTVWQGRYALPYGAGILIVAVTRWSRRPAAEPPTMGLAAICAMTAAAQLISVLGVAKGERTATYLSSSFTWWPHSSLLLSALVVLGALCITLSSWFAQRDTCQASAPAGAERDPDLSAQPGEQAGMPPAEGLSSRNRSRSPSG